MKLRLVSEMVPESCQSAPLLFRPTLIVVVSPPLLDEAIEVYIERYCVTDPEITKFLTITSCDVVTVDLIDFLQAFFKHLYILYVISMGNVIRDAELL